MCCAAIKDVLIDGAQWIVAWPLYAYKTRHMCEYTCVRPKSDIYTHLGLGVRHGARGKWRIARRLRQPAIECTYICMYVGNRFFGRIYLEAKGRGRAAVMVQHVVCVLVNHHQKIKWKGWMPRTRRQSAHIDSGKAQRNVRGCPKLGLTMN